MLVDPKDTLVGEIVAATRPEIKPIFGDKQIAVVVSGELKIFDTPLLSPPATLATSTLQSIVNAYGADWTKGEGEVQQVVHVCSASEVVLLHPAVGRFNQPFVYVNAKALSPRMPTGNWMDPADFITSARAAFFDSAGLEELLKTVSSLSSSKVLSVKDDGLGQLVESVSNVISKGTVSPSKCFALSPRRTFSEIESPPSTFGLRLRLTKRGDEEALELLLTEWTLQEWQTETIGRAAAWLRDKLGAKAVILS